MYDLIIGIRSLIMRINRVIIVTESNCCQVRRDIIGLCGVYQKYCKSQLGSRTRGIGQNIINEILFILRHNV